MADETKILYRDHLVERIPEAFQGSDNLIEYLRVAGKLFDDASEQIKLHDWYEDYRKTPEERLGMLINKYGIDITKTLPEEIIRSIVRDIHTIYTTNGTKNALEWVFRLINIEYTVENAWLIDPELYFNDLDLGKDIPGYGNDNPFDNLRENEEYLKIGRISSDSYIMGEDNQFWLEDTSYRIIGIPKIGPNELQQEGTIPTGDSLLDSALKQRSLNYTDFDYRNFVYGNAVDQANGTYFYGRSFNSEEQNIEELRIVGEEYGVGSRRSRKFVSATPYILLTIASEDYSRYINSYTTDEGEGYTLSQEDKIQLNEYLFEYLLLEVVKPSTVVILTISQRIELNDLIGVDDNLNLDLSDIEADLNALSGERDIIKLNDDLSLEREANIPDANPQVSFSCLVNAPSCESYVPIVDSHYTIGGTDQTYHADSSLIAGGLLKIGFNDFCDSLSPITFGAEVTLTWDEQPGVDGYKVYRSKTPLNENSLPSPVDEITGYQRTQYKHNASNDDQFYYAVEPYIEEGSTVSSVISTQITGCIPPFEDFTSSFVSETCIFTLDGFTGNINNQECIYNSKNFTGSLDSQTCMVPIEDFIITDGSVDYPQNSNLQTFNITSDDVQCDANFGTFTIDTDNVQCGSNTANFVIESDSVQCDSNVTSFNIDSDNVQCDFNETVHPIVANEGYVIGGSDQESHLYAGFTNSGVILIGDNTFTR